MTTAEGDVTVGGLRHEKVNRARPPGLCPHRAGRLVRLVLRQPVEVGARERRGRRGEGDAAPGGAAVVGSDLLSTLNSLFTSPGVVLRCNQRERSRRTGRTRPHAAAYGRIRPHTAACGSTRARNFGFLSHLRPHAPAKKARAAAGGVFFLLCTTGCMPTNRLVRSLQRTRTTLAVVAGAAIGSAAG